MHLSLRRDSHECGSAAVGNLVDGVLRNHEHVAAVVVVVGAAIICIGCKSLILAVSKFTDHLIRLALTHPLLGLVAVHVEVHTAGGPRLRIGQEVGVLLNECRVVLFFRADHVFKLWAL